MEEFNSNEKFSIKMLTKEMKQVVLRKMKIEYHHQKSGNVVYGKNFSAIINCKNRNVVFQLQKYYRLTIVNGVLDK